MKRIAWISLVVCVLVSVIFIEGGAFAQSTENRRRIVVFKPGTDKIAALALVAYSPVPGVTSVLVHDLWLLINALAIELPAILSDPVESVLKNSFLVEEVYEDTVGTVGGGRYPICIAPAPPPARESYPWGQMKIDVDLVHPQWQGSGVTVAVLDTGIANHTQLSGRILEGYNARAEGSLIDDNGHGTHMAGIIGADLSLLPGIVGVAPQARLLPVKVLDRDGAGYLSDVINGLQWVYNNGSPRAKVANMSIGFTDDSPPLLQAIQRLSRSDVIMVAAAGNRCEQSPASDEGGGDECRRGPLLDCDPEQTDVKYPAAYQAWVLAVRATDFYDAIPFYSLDGREVDAAAPGGSKETGIRILSTTTTTGVCQGSCYGWGSGTSQAAAHVTGAVALALQLRPGLSFEQVHCVLEATVEGPGRINVDKMVRALLAGQCP